MIGAQRLDLHEIDEDGRALELIAVASRRRSSPS